MMKKCKSCGGIFIGVFCPICQSHTHNPNFIQNKNRIEKNIKVRTKTMVGEQK